MTEPDPGYYAMRLATLRGPLSMQLETGPDPADEFASALCRIAEQLAAAAEDRLFLEILRAPVGVTHELRRMNTYGVLGRYIPAFGRIVGQMQHDLFHVYTVDQHILQVIRNLRRLSLPEFAHEYPFCTRLMAGLEQPWLLYLAALFHDIAKGRGGDRRGRDSLALQKARDERFEPAVAGRGEPFGDHRRRARRSVNEQTEQRLGSTHVACQQHAASLL
jgi:UTP:GlnB (protein PII) uridylyltransferase